MKPKNPNPPAAFDVDYYNTAPIFFDLDTMPLAKEELAADMPYFEAPKTYKDAAKIEAYIDKKRDEYISKAALSPITGRVLAIGGTTENDRGVFDYNDEKHTLNEFWNDFHHN